MKKDNQIEIKDLIEGLNKGIKRMRESIKFIENEKSIQKISDELIDLSNEFYYNSNAFANVGMAILKEEENGKNN